MPSDKHCCVPGCKSSSGSITWSCSTPAGKPLCEVIDVPQPSTSTGPSLKDNKGLEADNIEVIKTSEEVVMNSELGGEDVVLTPESLLGGAGGESEGAGSLGRRLLGAARRGEAAEVLSLMADGAPFAADWLGTSPLHLAAQHGHLATAGVLLRAGVSAEARTKVDRTPLHLAAYHGHAPLVSLLLEHRAAPDATDMLAMTPLHWAAERGHADAARVLLAHGADAGRVSKFGLTPRQLAHDNHHLHIVALIDQAAAAAAAHNDDQTEGMTSEEQQKQEALECMIPRVEETHTEEVVEDTQPEVPVSESAAARLLRSHGIAVSEAGDAGATVRAALRAGRTLLLSDAARRLLRDTAPRAPPAPPATSHPVLRVPELFITSQDPEFLRSQLLQAHLSLARAQTRVKELEARLEAGE